MNGDNPILPGALACPPELLRQAMADLDVDDETRGVTDPCVSGDDIRRAGSALGIDGTTFLAAVLHRRGGFLEHALNDYAGHPRERMWGGLEDKYRDGRRFALAVVERAELAEDLAMTNVVAGAPAFSLEPRYILVHPQEAEARGLDFGPAPAPWSAVRATASGRTLRTCASAYSHMVAKCDLSHVVMDRKPRPLDIAEATGALKSSDFLFAAWAAMPCAGAAYLPEVAARIDTVHDVAALLRHDTAHPRGEPGTWHLPLYCLWSDARAIGSPRPLLIHFIDDAVRAGVPAADALVDIVLQPIINAAAYLFIDLGCAHSAHGQNWRFELSPGGRPTGRIIFTDLTDLWEHPAIAEDNGIALDWDADAFQAHAESRESDIGGAFVDFVLFELLHRALLCFEQAYGVDVTLRRRTNDLVGAAVKARSERVNRFRDGPLRWFHSTYIK